MMWLFKPSSDKSPWELPMKWLANFEYNKKARSKPSRYPLLMWFERRHINWEAILYIRSGQSLVSLVDNEAYLTDLSDLYVSVIYIFWLCLFFIFFTGTVVRKVSKVRYLTNYYFIISVAHINRHLGFVPRYELLPSLPLCTFCAWFYIHIIVVSMYIHLAWFPLLESIISAVWSCVSIPLMISITKCLAMIMTSIYRTETILSVTVPVSIAYVVTLTGTSGIFVFAKRM